MQYTLPNGKIAENMKEGCNIMNITSHSFRRLVKKEIIKKIELESHGEGEQL